MNLNLRALVEKLNNTCKQALESAAGMCLSRTHYNVEIEHWFYQLLQIAENDLNCILQHYAVDAHHIRQVLDDFLQGLKTGNAQAPALSLRVVELIQDAWLIASLEYKSESICSGHLLCALLQDRGLFRFTPGLAKELESIPADTLRLLLAKLQEQSIENQQIKSGAVAASGDLQQALVEGNTKTTLLDQFTINLNELAQRGELDQVVGRDPEIRQMIDILTRRRQNNPILTGEPGVGKTAVVEGLALRVVAGEVPESLKNVCIRTLDLGLLQAGAGIKGEFEQRLKSVIKEIKQSLQPIILFIDEAHTIIGAGAQAGQGDAANLLKPALARGELRTIAATTWAEYKKYFEQDAALARRFQVIKIDEPNEKAAIAMMRGLVPALEKHHGVRILDDAVVKSVQLTDRYLSGRQLPDKSISVLDTACARTGLSHVTPPAVIEDCKRQLLQLSLEAEFLQRENSLSACHYDTLNKLEQKRRSLQKRLDELNIKWGKEKVLITQIHALRNKLENSGVAEIMDAPKKLGKSEFEKIQHKTQKKWRQLSQQLLKVQGELPLMNDCVNGQIVAEVVAGWTGVPVGKMLRNEIYNVLGLENSLAAKIIGQPYAISRIGKCIHTTKARMVDPSKPLGVFLFVGPSGTGKTETALALAELLYGGRQQVTTINMSEFKEEHKVSLLMGSPPGYVGYGEGGVLTEAIRRKPHSLLLLDEMEKAHAGVQDIFYQVFDKGTLKDGQGRDINFKNSIIIMTSNVGAELITKFCEEKATLPDHDSLVEILQPELLKTFKSAFLGRVNVIPYLTLCQESMKEIIKLQLSLIQQRVTANYGACLEYSPDLVAHIAKCCKESVIGARNIDHILTRGLLPELSTEFLTRLAEGKKVQKIKVSVGETSKNSVFVYEIS